MKTISLLGTLLVLALWWPGGDGQGTSCTLDNCKTCVNEALACETCQSRHVQDASGTCIACSSNCETCSLSNKTTLCTDCDDQHFLGTDGKCNTCPQDCASCANRESCTTCKTGFRQNSGGAECQACPSNCKECDGGSKCRECETGYYLDAGFTCSKCLTNCKVCKDGKTCEECDSARYFDAANEKCEECVDNCVSCTATGCTKCNTNYFLSGKVCLPCGDCDGTCSDATGCGKCDPGSFKSSDGSCLDCPHDELDSSQMMCQACVPKGANRVRFYNATTSCCDYCPENCQDCTDRDDCTTCKTGFYKNTTHGCLPCDSSCGTCTGGNANNCITCKESNHFEASNTCSACNDTCLTCDGATASDCLSCMSTGGSKRYLDSKQCKECPTDISTMDDKQCPTCAGAYVYQMPCVQCPAECRNCDVDRTTCTECVPGYYKSGSACMACHEDCNDTATCSGSAQNECLSCDDSAMEPVDGTCTVKCTGTQFRNSTDDCEDCDSEYGAQCTKCDASRCLECTVGGRYHLFPNRTACFDCQSLTTDNECTGTGICIWNSAACIACDSSCKECSDLDSNNTAEASECTSCYDNNLLNNECYECDSSCKTCGGPTANDCVTCPEWSYRASGGGTSACTNCTDSDCVKCSKAGVCEECISSMVAIKGVCTACPSSVTDAALLSRDFCNVCSKSITTSTYGSPRDSTCVKCADNCKSCAVPGECDMDKCTDNFVWQSKTCRAADCTDITTEKECETICAKGEAYSYTWVDPNCHKCPKNCKVCSSTTVCTTCEDGYSKNDDGVCVSCFGDATMCTSCGTSSRGRFYTSAGNKCYKCILNCLECDDETTCTKCSGKRYYNSVDKECQVCDTNCDTCKEENSREVCETCKEKTFKDDNSTCQNCPSGCKSCNQAKQCTECTNQYTFMNADGECIGCPTNCAVCQNATHCITCKTDFYKDNTGACRGCPTNCAVCSNATHCITCKTNFYKDNTGACRACPSNCASCNATGDCQACDPGYFLDGIECKLCSSALAGCVNCSSNSVCTNCQVDYFLKNDDTCTQCPTGCESCTAMDECTRCKTGNCLYTTTAGTNKKECVATLKRCETCIKETVDGTDVVTCLTCIDKTALEICQGCTSSKNCKECKDDKDKCTACSEGRYLDTTDDSCKDCDSGCKTCSATDKCIDCVAGKVLVTESSGKKCESCSSSCVECTNKDTCLKCTGPYYLDKTECKACQENCMTCTANDQCSACTLGYRLRQSPRVECERCDVDNCAKCDATRTTCTNCLTGYYGNVNGTECKQCAAKCAECSDLTGKCVRCTGGYYLSDTATCLKCEKSGCNKCKDPPPTCTDCNTDYSVSADKTACDKMCYVCSGSGCDSPTVKVACPGNQVCRATFENDEYTRMCGVKKAGETCVTANLDSNAECGDKEDGCCAGTLCNKGLCTSSTGSGAGQVKMGLLLSLSGPFLAVLSIYVH